MSPPPESPVRVRVLGPDDWALLRTLRLAALADAPYAYGSTFAGWEHADEHRWRDRLRSLALTLAALRDDEPVGLVSGCGPEDGTAELISMWVAPSARGLGVGALLIEAVVDWAAGQGARRVLLHVTEHNPAATRLYERHGFVPTGEVTVRPDGIREVHMDRALSPPRR